jgi:hypothetical protein
VTIFLLANSIFIGVSVIYGWLAGDRHDREGVAWIAAAIGCTLWAQTSHDKATQTLLIAIVDGALLLAMISLALRSSRYWPTWFAGLHLATVATNLAIPVFPEFGLFRVIAAFFGIPAILAMVIGIFLDRLAVEKPPRAAASRSRS